MRHPYTPARVMLLLNELSKNGPSLADHQIQSIFEAHRAGSAMNWQGISRCLEMMVSHNGTGGPSDDGHRHCAGRPASERRSGKPLPV